MDLIEVEKIVRKVVKDTILPKLKAITIENKEFSKVEDFLTRLEDFFNDNFEKMYDQMILYGTWIIVRLKDGSLELV